MLRVIFNFLVIFYTADLIRMSLCEVVSDVEFYNLLYSWQHEIVIVWNGSYIKASNVSKVEVVHLLYYTCECMKSFERKIYK